MPLTKIEANNFTVFENIEIPFNKGLNVLVVYWLEKTVWVKLIS